MRFPLVTIRDMVRAQRVLIEHLGVRQLAMVAGGSIGGQQALEWGVAYPELVQKVIVVAATAALTAQAIAFSEVERQAIMVDPLWQGGNYAPGHGPEAGLSVARMLAMITYQSEEAMEMRFARRYARNRAVPAPSRAADLGSGWSRCTTWVRPSVRRGKSGLHWARCQVTPGRQRRELLATDSATENTPPTRLARGGGQG